MSAKTGPQKNSRDPHRSKGDAPPGRRRRTRLGLCILTSIACLSVALALFEKETQTPEIVAMVMSPNAVALTWAPGATGTAGMVERTTGAEGHYVHLADISPHGTLFVDRGLWPLTHYYYRLRVGGQGPQARRTLLAEVTTPADNSSLPAPLLLAARPLSATSLAVAWQDQAAAEETGYLLERSEDKGMTYRILAALEVVPGQNRCGYTDRHLWPSTHYVYRVRSHSNGGRVSPFAGPAEAETLPRPRGEPEEPYRPEVDVTTTSVTFSWSGAAGVSFDVERAAVAQGAVGTFSALGSVTGGPHVFHDATALAECAYYYRVRARNNRGASDFCPAVEAITASPLGTRTARNFDVGPGQAYPAVASVPWNRLGPGDTVRIHYRPLPYREKIQISGRGTAGAPIRIVGVAGPSGELPILDGGEAVTGTATAYPYSPAPGSVGTSDRGIVTVTVRTGYSYGFKPGYIVVEGLQVQNASPLYRYTDQNHAARRYASDAAGVYIERGDHIVIRGCRVTGCGNGIFGGGGGSDALTCSDLMIERNDVFGNGTAGGDRQHNIYCESIGITYQDNHLGPLRAGALGDNLKDRSSGTVVRRNRIEAGSHLLDLVEPQDSFNDEVVDPGFGQTLVYDNVLIQGPGQGSVNLIHYGGDNGDAATYRKGVLVFTNNTVVIRENRSSRYGSGLLHMEADEAADVHNNIIFVTSRSDGARATKLFLVNGSGVANFGRNWVSPWWMVSRAVDHSQAYSGGDWVTNWRNMPGFVDAGRGDFRLLPSSPCAGRAEDFPLFWVNGRPAPLRDQADPGLGRRRKNGPPHDLGATVYLYGVRTRSRG